MAEALSVFLSKAARRGFVWGAHDCMLFAADWARSLTGHDPAWAWRGTYRDEAGAHAVLENEGGPHSIMAQGLQPLGWRHLGTWDRRPGDIVLARPAGHPCAAGVVSGGGRIALLTRRGLVLWPIPVIAIWRHDREIAAMRGALVHG